jgi:NADH-quinone oxidoreductase subunit F
MEFIPHLLIEGMITASFACANLSLSTFVENTCGFTKFRKSYCRSKSSWLGKTYWEPIDLELYVHIGAGAYICEETALIGIIRRGLVSNTISCSLIMGKPTVVNNVETIASVPWIVNNCDDYAK